MKRKIVMILLAILLIASNIIYAKDPNVENSEGKGSKNIDGNTYVNSNCPHGVRISIFEIEKKKEINEADKVKGKIGYSIDVFNAGTDLNNTKGMQRAKDKKSKYEYIIGHADFNWSKIQKGVDEFSFQILSKSMPTLFTVDNTGSLPEIKEFFGDEGMFNEILKKICSSSQIKEIKKHPERYKVLIEPILIFYYEGVKYALTATEIAFFDEKHSKNIDNAESFMRKRLYTITHENCPKSMFLSWSELELTPPSQAEINSTVSSGWGLPLGVIKSYMGCCVLSKETKPEEDEGEPKNETYDYLVDRDVIVSVWLTATDEEMNLENPAYCTFTVNGESYTHDNIYLPKGGSQLAWFKWHTPKEKGTVTITIDSNCELSANNIIAKIGEIVENEPPDPEGRDRCDDFDYSKKGTIIGSPSNSWTVYDCYWKAQWELNPDFDPEKPESEDNPKMIDNGYYEFPTITYIAKLNVKLEIKPDENCPTAEGKKMGSGYGFNAEVTLRSPEITRINSGIIYNAAKYSEYSDYADIGAVIMFFPEFYYKTYNRVLEKRGRKYEFRVNDYSHFDARVHFTPVWFKDGKYIVLAKAIKAYTPAGELSVGLSDYLEIWRSVFDDWKVAPVRE